MTRQDFSSGTERWPKEISSERERSPDDDAARGGDEEVEPDGEGWLCCWSNPSGPLLKLNCAQDEANKKSEDEYPEVPAVEGDAPPAPAAAAGEDAPAPAPEAPAEAPAPAEEEVKGEPEL